MTPQFGRGRRDWLRLKEDWRLGVAADSNEKPMSTVKYSLPHAFDAVYRPRSQLPLIPTVEAGHSYPRFLLLDKRSLEVTCLA